MDWIVSERGEADHLVVPSGPLVGPPGSDFVALQLGVGDPQSAIREIQERGSVRDPRCVIFCFRTREVRGGSKRGRRGAAL